MSLTTLSLTEAAQHLSQKEISPVELTQAYLERIKTLDPQINAFITVTAETALERARKAEQEIQRGEYLGPLHGIPIALKDLYETAGIRTTAGSSFFAEYIPERDAAVVEKLRQAGVVFLGKLNMHEIALGVTNVNPHFGPCRNPWNTDRVSGGSSGGSAAALAAGLCLGALGSDTGGSIRIPASLCGVAGLKPTRGRVSLRGVVPLSWNLDHAGPMGRQVTEVALLLQAIAGYDAEDPGSLDVRVSDYLSHLEEGVKGLRIAVATGEYFENSDPEVMESVNQAGRVFSNLGAQVREVDFSQARQAAQANGLLVVADAAAFHHERIEAHPEGFGADVLQRLQQGVSASSTEYALARRTGTVLRREFETFFRDVDLLLMPSTPIPAPPIEGQDAVAQARRLTRFTAPFNLTGLPAISIPCGLTSGGMPTGLQIISRPWAEALVLQAARAFEREIDWRLPIEPISSAG